MWQQCKNKLHQISVHFFWWTFLSPWSKVGNEIRVGTPTGPNSMVKRTIEKIIIHPAFTTTRKDKNIGISIEMKKKISYITFQIVSSFLNYQSDNLLHLFLTKRLNYWQNIWWQIIFILFKLPLILIKNINLKGQHISFCL